VVAITTSVNTPQIDSAAYPTLEKQFGLRDIYPAPEYLGGLSPTYPMAYAYVDCIGCYEPAWEGGGLICSCKQIVIKKGQEYAVIKTKDELRSLFAPISSSREALGYAAMMTETFPVFTESFFKKSYQYKRNVSTSRVQQVDGYYIVQLYDHKAFGCSHPYSVVLVKVMKDGGVEILRTEEAFRDPAENSLCVD
jgi:hypothetical protein